MYSLEVLLKDVKTLGITGHIRPDGDCIGSCLGLYNYVKDNMPEIETDVYLEEFPEIFNFLAGAKQVKHSWEENKEYDMFFILDSSDIEITGPSKKYIQSAKRTFLVDHHITNTGFCNERYVKPEVSSSCEVLFDLLDEKCISKNTAECLYTGMVHDTGVFKYQQTTSRTMKIAGILMDKGIDFTSIIDDTYYKKTYVQNQILGRTLLESTLILNGRCIFSVVNQKEMEFYNVTSKDFDGIVEQLRNTKGVEVAIFIHELEPQVYKASLRSNKYVDVSQVASYFGGGGHIRAAGCTIRGRAFDVINSLTYYIEQQMRKEQKND